MELEAGWSLTSRGGRADAFSDAGPHESAACDGNDDELPEPQIVQYMRAEAEQSRVIDHRQVTAKVRETVANAVPAGLTKRTLTQGFTEGFFICFTVI